MTRKFQPRRQCIQSAYGETLTEAAQIADRWNGYCEDLYEDQERNKTGQEYWEHEPPSGGGSQSHGPWWGPGRTVQSKRRDNTGQNAQNMCGDMGNWWVARGMDVLHIHSTSQERWSQQCASYRTIALVSHASKILLRIITVCTVVQNCCKGDEPCQWNTKIFRPSEIRNPLTDRHETWQGWLRRGYHPISM